MARHTKWEAVLVSKDNFDPETDYISDGFPRYFKIVDAGNNRIFNLDTYYYFVRGFAIMEKHAHLIASAPEMAEKIEEQEKTIAELLEACRRACTLIGDGYSDNARPLAAKDVLLDAVIKTRGRDRDKAQSGE